MENLGDYLTAVGWKADWKKTREDCLGCRKDISDFIKDENGSVPVTVLLMLMGVSLMATGISFAYHGKDGASAACYFGAGVSYTIGMLSIIPKPGKKK